MACWPSAHRADLDAAQEQLDADAATGTSYYATDAIHVPLRELWFLSQQQRRAGEGGACRMAGRSIVGLSMLREGSAYGVWWRRLMMALDLTYTSFYIPITLALFTRYAFTTREAIVLFVVDVVTGFFFAANMLHALHVPARVCAGYYQLLVSNGWGVATLYRTKGTFWIDLATTLPWVMQLLAPAFSSNKAAAKSLLAVMMLLRLARLVRVVDLVKHLARGQLLPHSSRSMMLVGSWYLLSLCYCGLVSVNLLGCVWYLAGTIDSAEGSWLESVGGRDMLAAPIWDRYFAAIYFTITTITTTGYGDVIPHNSLEMGVAIVIMLAGALFMSVVIGSVSSLLNSSSADAQRSQRFRDKVAHLDRFFKQGMLGGAIEQDIFEYHYYVRSVCEQEQEEWQQVVSELPCGLRGTLMLRVLRTTCARLAQQLGEGVPEVVLAELAAGMERYIIAPGDTLSALDSSVDCLWLLRHGVVLAIHPLALVRPECTALLDRDVSLAHLWGPPGRQPGGRQPGGHGPRPGKTHNLLCHMSARSAAEQQRQQQLLQQHGWWRRLLASSRRAAPVPGAGVQQQHSQQSQQSWTDVEFAHVSEASAELQGAGVAGANAAQLLSSEGLLVSVTGPALFPAYALAPPPPAGAEPSAGAGGEQGSAPPAAAAALEAHPVWLRTASLCVLYRIDLRLVRVLCQVCPQLHHNISSLLQLGWQPQ